jgi:hypothetical protein
MCLVYTHVHTWLASTCRLFTVMTGSTCCMCRMCLLCVHQVGDYVLSPDIVVERKALPDLFASLGSGRLYHQVRQWLIKARGVGALVRTVETRSDWRASTSLYHFYSRCIIMFASLPVGSGRLYHQVRSLQSP